MNLIDINGKLVSEQWFDEVGDFNEDGISVVVLNGRFNFIDIKGNLLS